MDMLWIVLGVIGVMMIASLKLYVARRWLGKQQNQQQRTREQLD